MPKTKPLFPFSLSAYTASVLCERESEYRKEVERAHRYSNVESLTAYATLHEDGRVELFAHMSTDNGFVQTGGTFFRKELQFTPEQIAAYSKKEIELRALLEIQAEDDAAFQRRVRARAAKLTKELL